MARARYPFWLLLAENELPMAFSTVAKMEAFLECHKDVDWSIRLINRYSVPFLIKGLKEDGHTHICFDANTDDNSSISLNELKQI